MCVCVCFSYNSQNQGGSGFLVYLIRILELNNHGETR